MYVITVTFSIKPEHTAEFREAMIAQARNSLTREAGCSQFDVCTDPGDADRIFLYEIYDDEAAFKHHLQTQHFKEFDAAVQPWLASKTVTAWERIEA